MTEVWMDSSLLYTDIATSGQNQTDFNKLPKDKTVQYKLEQWFQMSTLKGWVEAISFVSISLQVNRQDRRTH